MVRKSRLDVNDEMESSWVRQFDVVTEIEDIRHRSLAQTTSMAPH